MNTSQNHLCLTWYSVVLQAFWTSSSTPGHSVPVTQGPQFSTSPTSSPAPLTFTLVAHQASEWPAVVQPKWVRFRYRKGRTQAVTSPVGPNGVKELLATHVEKSERRVYAKRKSKRKGFFFLTRFAGIWVARFESHGLERSVLVLSGAFQALGGDEGEIRRLSKVRTVC